MSDINVKKLIKKLSLAGIAFVLLVGATFAAHPNSNVELKSYHERLQSDKKFGRLTVFFNQSDVMRTDQDIIYGKNLDLLECVAKETDFDFSIIDVSWSRGQFLLKVGKIDVMLNVSQDSFRESYATASNPVGDGQYVLVLYPGTHTSLNIDGGSTKLLTSIKDRNYTIATILGSAESNKLQEYGIIKQTRGSGVEEMVRLISTGLADGFVSELSLVEEYEKISGRNLKKLGLFNIPYVYYVSNRIISAHPDFMKHLNRSIGVCTKKIKK